MTNELKLALETRLPSQDLRKANKGQRGFLRKQSPGKSPLKSLLLQVPLPLHCSTAFPVLLQALVDSVHPLQLSISVCQVPGENSMVCFYSQHGEGQAPTLGAPFPLWQIKQKHSGFVHSSLKYTKRHEHRTKTNTKNIIALK